MKLCHTTWGRELDFQLPEELKADAAAYPKTGRDDDGVYGFSTLKSISNYSVILECVYSVGYSLNAQPIVWCVVFRSNSFFLA